jgi:cardiolipin synthase A/B
MHRLLDARERGVEVEIIVPGPHADKRFVQLAGEAVYQPLLDAGVKLWSFQPSMFHAKIMTVDGIVANVGSANLNARSNTLDEEINVVVIDDDVVRVLDEQFDEDLRRCVRIESGRWQRRSLAQRAAERITIPVRRVF